MRLSNEKYEEIKNTVIDTFEQYNVKYIPISGFEIATKMGLKIIPYSLLNEKQREMSMKYSSDGYSIETQNEWRIYYNDSCKCYGRINQTIMHEVGHFVLGHINGGEEEESEAKFFAKYALAPPPLIHNICKDIEPDTIKKTFNISYQAAYLAYQYYRNWLQFGNRNYTNYEEKMLSLFNFNIA